MVGGRILLKGGRDRVKTAQEKREGGGGGHTAKLCRRRGKEERIAHRRSGRRGKMKGGRGGVEGG